MKRAGYRRTLLDRSEHPRVPVSNTPPRNFPRNPSLDRVRPRTVAACRLTARQYMDPHDVRPGHIHRESAPAGSGD